MHHFAVQILSTNVSLCWPWTNSMYVCIAVCVRLDLKILLLLVFHVVCMKSRNKVSRPHALLFSLQSPCTILLSNNIPSTCRRVGLHETNSAYVCVCSNCCVCAWTRMRYWCSMWYAWSRDNACQPHALFCWNDRVWCGPTMICWMYVWLQRPDVTWC